MVHPVRDEINRLKAGDKDAWATIAALLRRELWGVALGALHNEADAEDVLSDLTIELFDTRQAWPVDPGGFTARLVRRCRDRCRDVLKRAHRNREVSVGSSLDVERLAGLYVRDLHGLQPGKYGDIAHDDYGEESRP